MVDSNYKDAGKSHKWEFEENEELEFVHKCNPGTQQEESHKEMLQNFLKK